MGFEVWRSATRLRVHEELGAVPMAGGLCRKQHAVVEVAARPRKTVPLVPRCWGTTWHGLCAICITICVWEG